MTGGQAGQLPASMRATISTAINTCRDHAIARIELPYAYLTAGRLSLLLDKAFDALNWYARAISYCREGSRCMPPGLLAEEAKTVKRMHGNSRPPKAYEQVSDLLSLAATGSADGSAGCH